MLTSLTLYGVCTSTHATFKFFPLEASSNLPVICDSSQSSPTYGKTSQEMRRYEKNDDENLKFSTCMTNEEWICCIQSWFVKSHICFGIFFRIFRSRANERTKRSQKIRSSWRRKNNNRSHHLIISSDAKEQNKTKKTLTHARRRRIIIIIEWIQSANSIEIMFVNKPTLFFSGILEFVWGASERTKPTKIRSEVMRRYDIIDWDGGTKIRTNNMKQSHHWCIVKTSTILLLAVENGCRFN